MKLHVRLSLAVSALITLHGGCATEGDAGCDTFEAPDGAIYLECADGDAVTLYTPGEDRDAEGVGAAVRVTEGAAPGCDAGGALVEVGADADGDGVLADAEVTSSFEVCDGGDGDDGDDGDDGGDGRGPLASSREEPAGANCPGGGLRVEAGLDADGDGLLDPDEVDPDATAFRCSPFTPPYRFTALSLGSRFSCGVTDVGGVKCWGGNFRGRLGDGTTTPRDTPADVSGLPSGVVALATGDSHACALTGAGALKCWGDNSRGQLGDGSRRPSSVPVDVVGLSAGVSSVSVGASHTCAVDAAGAVSCWGGNSHGQLGDGSTTDRATPVGVVGLTGGVASTAGGFDHTCARTTSGAVTCWGGNRSGQLGDGSSTDRPNPVGVVGLSSGVASISSGNAHTCALTDAGALECWGRNSSGQLGDTTRSSRDEPFNVFGAGIAAASTGDNYTCALTDAGALRCWGDNSSGQLGDGSTEDRLSQTAVTGLGQRVTGVASGSAHTCALVDSETMCWGDDGSGQLGIGPSPYMVSTPTRVATD